MARDEKRSRLSDAIDQLASTIKGGHLLAASDPAGLLSEARAEIERLREALYDVGALLAEHGCDCERCLACRVDAALRGEEE